MSSLEIEFHCLCLFVPDPKHKRVHVLMPATGHHGTGGKGHNKKGHAHMEPHVVRIVHPGLPKRGVPMEGWALRLGRKGGMLDTSMTVPPAIDATVVDLNQVTGRSLHPDYLEEKDPHPKVIARVTLREGRLVDAVADEGWSFRGVPIKMATRCTWRIDDFAGGRLHWHSLGARGKHPVETFDTVDHVHIFHATEKSIQETHTSLDVNEVREHFQAFLDLYDITPDDECYEDFLPENDNEDRTGVNCPPGVGSVASGRKG